MQMRMPLNEKELRLFVEDARENGKLTFNGSVLQLTLGKYQRLNFYTKAFDQTGPHNHALGFMSWVISGMFVNAIYERRAVANGPYRRYIVDRKAGVSTFNRTDETYDMEFMCADTMYGSVAYRMEAHPIHTLTIIEPAITYVERDRETPGIQDAYFNEAVAEAPVVAPVIDLVESWALIDKMLAAAKIRTPSGVTW